MNFDLKTPCKDCPFLRSRQFQLLVERVQEILDDMIHHQATFSCHKTVDYDDGEGSDDENTQHCAGALILLEHVNRPNQMMRIAERLGLYDRRKLDMKADVFRSRAEMLAAPHWIRRGGVKKAPGSMIPVKRNSLLSARRKP